jgi:hypothetical protein
LCSRGTIRPGWASWAGVASRTRGAIKAGRAIGSRLTCRAGFTCDSGFTHLAWGAITDEFRALDLAFVELPVAVRICAVLDLFARVGAVVTGRLVCNRNQRGAAVRAARAGLAIASAARGQDRHHQSKRTPFHDPFGHRLECGQRLVSHKTRARVGGSRRATKRRTRWNTRSYHPRAAASAYRSAKQLGLQVAERHYLDVARGIPRDARTLEAAMQVEAQIKSVTEAAQARAIVTFDVTRNAR